MSNAFDFQFADFLAHASIVQDSPSGDFLRCSASAGDLSASLPPAGPASGAIPVVAAMMALAGLFFSRRNDEQIVFVSDDGRPIGVGPKLASHNADTRLHAAFSVFIFNSRGELLLQRRSLKKKTWPGVWSNSCCGHPMPGEETLAAAQRRLDYELGLGGIALEIILPDFRYRAELNGIVENEICPVFVGFCDEMPSVNRAEVAEIKWVRWLEIVDAATDNRFALSPWAIEESKLLAGSELFKAAFAANCST